MAEFLEEAQNPIENHGIIGDMRSAALVADTGSIDFLCWPDFDSPSVFTALLDSNDAGIFQLAPDLPDARRQQIYLPDTNVLQTRWIARDAVVEVTDLMPIGRHEDDLPRVVRRIEVPTSDGRQHADWIAFALTNNTDEQVDRLIVAPHYRMSGSGLFWPDLGLLRIAAITPSTGDRPVRQEGTTADISALRSTRAP